ncbi:ArsR/SmtB family transcription factor [Woodsholea maritima]|uniref:ArsR/SmtB family transcription factor n=1 Tax=Woodsholea maritima TaxID=240237 RepID=UPI000365CF5C|nr:metalloregulator ArsR/SmtB family transcription factor [Woodsholea maritima]
MTYAASSKDLLSVQAVKTAHFLKELSNPNRLMIACELLDGERSVSQLETAIAMMQPNLSRDLVRMRKAGLLKARRQSKQVFYSIQDPRLCDFIAALCDIFGPTVQGNGAHD